MTGFFFSQNRSTFTEYFFVATSNNSPTVIYFFIFPSSNYACVAPFANWPPKEWPTESYLKICESLFNQGVSKIYILGSETESVRFDFFQKNFGNKVINRCGKQPVSYTHLRAH